jgi:hypothetical protein
MKAFRTASFLLGICSLVFVAASTVAPGGSAAASSSDSEKVSAAARQELASARNATAQYHDVEQAIADGYVLSSPYVPGEGYHYVNGSLIDCNFDPERPEALLYVPSGEGLRLVGVEYVIPIVCSPTEAPEGFAGDADEWEFMAEGRPIWARVAWIWLGNPNGIFAEPPHPLIP